MATPVRHGNKWRIRWYDAQGTRHSEVYEKEKDAHLALRRHHVAIEEAMRGLRPQPTQPHYFNELADRWIEHRGSTKRTIKGDISILRRHLRPAFGALWISDVTVQRVEAWQQGFAASEKTLHNVLTLLVSLLNYAVELEWLGRCPSIKKPRIVLNDMDFMYLRTDDEVARFLRAAMDEGPSVHALYAAAIFTGMRAGELAGLRWSDVDLDRRLITAQRSYDGPTKAGYIRRIPILDALLPTLRAWRLRNSNERVFPNQAGEQQHPSARVFQEVFQRVLRAAGFQDVERRGKKRPPLTFHSLRHTFASHWMMKGGDIFKLQRICGWKSFAMVQRYAHLAPEAFAADYGRLGGPATAEVRLLRLPS